MSAEEPRGDQEITLLLQAWRQGDDLALEHLVPLVYNELHRIARNEMGRERRDHTLQPTALVNEVYLRLVNLKAVSWNDRAHFFALTARLMRRILVDLARAKGYQKRGGGAPKASLDEAAAVPTMQPEDLVALDDAMQRLAAMDPRRSQVVELRFFGGLEIEEIAEVLKVSRHTVMRDWALARTWLFRELKRELPADD
jgi:RNA polymerase sigma factor (TIGR02999 family)